MKLLILFAFLPIVYADFDHTYIDPGSTFSITYNGVTYDMEIHAEVCPAGQSVVAHADFVGNYAEQENFCQAIYAQSGFGAEGGVFHPAANTNGWQPGGCWADGRSNMHGSMVSVAGANANPDYTGVTWVHNYCIVSLCPNDFSCSGATHLKDDLTTPCAGLTCQNSDCCDPNPTCDNTNGLGTGFLFSLCGADQSLVSNMSITCAGASCIQSDCCENNPTCAPSFSCSAGTHLKDDLTAPCDTLTCDNNDCCEANPQCWENAIQCDSGFHLKDNLVVTCATDTCGNSDCCDANPTCNNVNGQGTPFSPLSCGAGTQLTSTMTTVCATGTCLESDCCEDILCGPNYLCLSGVLNANGNCQTTMCSQTECCIEDQTCSQAAHTCPGGQTVVDDNICPGGACTDLLCCVMPPPPLGGGGAPVCSSNLDQVSCCIESGCAWSNNDCVSIFELFGNTDQCTVKYQPATTEELESQIAGIYPARDGPCITGDPTGIYCCFNSAGFVGISATCPSGQYRMEEIDISLITDLSQMFWGLEQFNAPLNKWDVSHVTNFYGMFYGATAYSQDLSCWDVSSGTTYYQMFWNNAGMQAQDPLCWDLSGGYSGAISVNIASYPGCVDDVPCLNCPNKPDQGTCMAGNLCAWTNNGCFVGQADATCTPLTADYAACLANPDCGYNLYNGVPNCIGASSTGGFPPCQTHNGDENACCAQAGCAWATGNDCIDETALGGNPNLCNAAPAPAPAAPAPAPAAPAPAPAAPAPAPAPAAPAAPAPAAPAPAPAAPAPAAPAPAAPAPATPAPAPGVPCFTHDGDETACCAQDGCAWTQGNDCIDETQLFGNPDLCPAEGTSGIVIPPPSPAPAAPAPAPTTAPSPSEGPTPSSCSYHGDLNACCAEDGCGWFAPGPECIPEANFYGDPNSCPAASPAPAAPAPAAPAPAAPSPSSPTDCTQIGGETACMNAGCAWNNIGCFDTESRPACDLLTGDIGCLDYNNCGLTMSGGIVICTGSAAIQSPPPTASSTDGACASSPCANGGICSDDGNGGFSCACDQWNTGWTGATCETDFLECAFFHRNDCPNYRIQQNGADVPCTNSGQCTAIQPSKCYQGFCSSFTYECNDFGGGYSCDCGAGFFGDGYTCRDVTAPCLENEYVLNNLCTPCPPGTENMAGEDPTGANTTCSAIPCTAVVTYEELTNLTIGCMVGTATGTFENCGCSCTDGFSGFFCNECALGHGFTGSECAPCVAPKASDTTLYSESCHAQVCGVDKRLVSTNFNTSSLDESVNCEDCPAGMESNASSLICTDIVCAENELVSGNACVACPGIQTNPAGDVASGADTTCSCPPGTTVGTGDACDPIICSTDHYVSDHVCTPCPTGLVNLAGDDASGANTTCVAPCDVDYYVAGNICTECPEGFGWYGGDNPEGSDTPVAFPNPPGADTICYNSTMCGDRQFGKVYCDWDYTTNCTNDRCECVEGMTGETCSRDAMTAEEIQNLVDTYGSDFIVSDAEVDAFHDDLRLHILDVTTAESRKPNAVVKDVVLQNAVTLKNLNTYQKILADGRTAMFAVAPDLHVTDTCVADPTTCTSLDLADVPDNTVVFLQTGNRNGAYSVLSKGAVLITRQRQYTPADTYYMRCFDNDAGVWQPATLHTVPDLYMCNGFAILIGSQVSMCEPTIGDDIGTCGEHGACAIDGLSVYCECDDGWSGDHCEIPFTVPTHCHQFNCDDYGGHAGDISIPDGTAQSALVGLCCVHNTMADFDAACDAATDRETHFDLGCCHRKHCI